MKFITYIIILGMFIISSCTSKKQPSEPEKKAEQNPGIITLNTEQFKAVGIELGSIEQKNLRSIVKANGYLELPPQNKASVSALMGGVVKSIPVLEGKFVKKGQTLAILQHPDFIKMQESYITERNNLAYQETEFNRQKELATQNAGTGKIYQKAESDYNTSKIRVSSLEAQLKMLSVNIAGLAKGHISESIILTSPIDGYVGHINASVGAFAEPNKTLFEIADNSKIHVDLLVYEKDLFKVKEGQKVEFILANQPDHLEEHKNKTIEGEIFGINKSFESDTKALTVHASIKNENHELIPGMYVNAIIDVGHQLSSVVPADAIVRSDGKEYIYILAKEKSKEAGSKNETQPAGEEYSFKNIEVTTGITELGYTQITPLSEIPAGTKIVTKGAFYILSKAKGGSEEE